MIKKKADIVLISIHLSCTAENFKAIMKCVRELDLAKYNTLQQLEGARQKLYKSNSFSFSSDFNVLLFDFSPT